MATLNEAYKAAQLNGKKLSAGHAFYLATRGLLIARSGEIVNRLTAASMPVSAELAQRALRPLELGLVGALVVAALIRESYPTANR
jgi:hypothetical protein